MSRCRHRRAFFVGCCAVTVCLLLSLVAPSAAQLTITESVTPTVGTVMGGPANRQFILNTDDTVTGPDAVDYLFGAVSGELIFMKRRGPELIHVTAENLTTSGGLVANAILCKWHNQPQTTCDAVGFTERVVGRRRLLIGVDITTTQFHWGGDTATVSFEITATFL